MKKKQKYLSNILFYYFKLIGFQYNLLFIILEPQSPNTRTHRTLFYDIEKNTNISNKTLNFMFNLRKYFLPEVTLHLFEVYSHNCISIDYDVQRVQHITTNHQLISKGIIFTEIKLSYNS